MTKSIEQIATDYAGEPHDENENRKLLVSCVKELILKGAKARDAQWSAVVNELRESLKWFSTNSIKGWEDLSAEQLRNLSKDYMISAMKHTNESLTKADQMLKEMGIK